MPQNKLYIEWLIPGLQTVVQQITVLAKIADSASQTQGDHTSTARFENFLLLSFLISPPACEIRQGRHYN